MATYRVAFNTGAWATVTVEAENADDAINLAYDELPSDICAHCSGWGQKWSRGIGEEWELDESDEFAANPELVEGA